MLTPLIVSDPGTEFRKIKQALIFGSRIWPLSPHTDTVLQPVGSNLQLVMPPDA